MAFMGRAWQRFDFEGGGLQSANLVLARALRKRGVAYILWVFFPLGAHALYLRAPVRAAIYVLLSLLLAGVWFSSAASWSAVPLAGLVAFALYDLWWIDRRVVTLNKEIRMRVYMGQTQGAPRGFKGHYTDDADIAGYTRLKESERAGHPARDQQTSSKESGSRRAASFAQQEALLRELARKKRD